MTISTRRRGIVRLARQREQRAVGIARRAAAVAAVLAIAVVPLAACATVAPEVSVEEGVAVLDRETLSVSLPLAEYQFSPQDYRTLTVAEDVILDGCLARAGRDARYPDRNRFPVEPDPYRYFGVWVEDDAAEFGFTGETSPPSVVAGFAWQDTLSEQDFEVISQCYTTDEWGSLDYSDFVYVGIAGRGETESYNRAETDERYVSKVTEYNACLTALGYKISDEHFGIDGNEKFSGEAGTRAALQDVGCKDEVNLIQSLTDIVAAYELDFIEKNEAALVEGLAEKQAFLDRAAAIIARG